MMDSIELINRLIQSETVQSEIPMGLQLGLPWIEKRNGSLCICFKPHREELDGELINYYLPQFEISWVWPFEHLASFHNLTLERRIDVSQPSCKINVKRLLSVGKYGMDDLYSECSKLLSIQEEKGSITDAWISSYQEKYNSFVEILGLGKIYNNGTVQEQG